VINTATKTVMTVLSGNGADAVAVAPDGTHVYVANFTADTVSVFCFDDPYGHQRGGGDGSGGD
jgi:DNA-binding beta-propeller fold protein YncE